MLVNTVDRGGNMLLNVGPDADGMIPPAHVARLMEVGQWLNKNGESIYGTRPGPFEPVDDYYGATHKGNNIYVHLVKLPDGATEIKLPALARRVTACKILGGDKIAFTQNDSGIILKVDSSKLDAVVTTFALTTQ